MSLQMKGQCCLGSKIKKTDRQTNTKGILWRAQQRREKVAVVHLEWMFEVILVSHLGGSCPRHTRLSTHGVLHGLQRELKPSAVMSPAHLHR